MSGHRADDRAWQRRIAKQAERKPQHRDKYADRAASAKQKEDDRERR